MDANQEGQDDHHHPVMVVLLPIIKEIIIFLAVGGMVVGGVVPFIPQYRKIKKTKDVTGFSSYVCLVLLIANILRVCFWFGVHYESPLLAQSVIMIGCMLVMTRLCVVISNESSAAIVHRPFLSLKYFWKWTSFNYYLLFILLFSLIVGLITFLLLKISIFVQLLGFSSLLTEAMLGVPQLWKNMRNRSTEGMSVQMVLFWTSGDSFKTVYFILRKSPLQFWVCGMMQVSVDIFILLQVAMYRRRRQTSSTTHVL